MTTHVDYNQPCAICHARIVLHTMFFKDGDPDFEKNVKCPGGSWVHWDAVLGIVKLCTCCQATLQAGTRGGYCPTCSLGLCCGNMNPQGLIGLSP